MAGGTLPGTDADDDAGSDRIVFHVDMDCFYASCERLRRPELADEPLVVGMGYEAGEAIGAVATASYEARAFGVESAMPISEALDLLPRRVNADPDDPDAPDPDEAGRYLPVDLDFYKEVASDVKTVLRDCADVLREVSVDEAYLDVTDRTAWDAAGGESTATGPAETRTLAEGYARHIKERIEREAGVPASVGVAPNMSTAKIASDADKPDGLVVVPPGEVESFLASLPTAEIHGVGPVTERTLAELGIETAGDLAAADPDRLADELGDRGRELYRRARGDDDREVTPTGLPKSLSRESSLSATADEERKRETVRALAADVARRARERGCLYRTIGIKAVEPPYEVNTRARSLPGPVDDPTSWSRWRSTSSASSPVTESVSSGCASRNSTSPRAIRRRSAGSTRVGAAGAPREGTAEPTATASPRPSQSPPTARAGSSPTGWEASRTPGTRARRTRPETDRRARPATDRHRSATGRERWRDLLRIRGEHSPPSAGI